VAHLLLRFIEPHRGTISVDGVSLRDLPTAHWRAQLAWVPQNPYLFHATVAENIGLARPDASLDAVIEAARLAHAHEFIETLPRGYDTPVGERGARLSGGQAQRIALARAFLKDVPFLILDEATAHLDPATEELVQAALGRLLRGRTALIIAHRLSTVYQADQILVIAGGRAVETGDHASLLAENGLYRRLVMAYGGAA
jgi:ABC-type multidrug transport system fused ATPase/permease subunit